MQEKNTVAEGPWIAIVDDDDSMRDAIKTLIGSIGLSVEEFATAEDFLNSARSQVCDCLILDVRMPGLGGLELQRRLAADNRPVPIVFITAHYNEAERERAMQAGAVDFLRKPFTERALLKAIRASLAIHGKVIDASVEDFDLDSV
jgi:FixJ family two-component response regulator